MRRLIKIVRVILAAIVVVLAVSGGVASAQGSGKPQITKANRDCIKLLQEGRDIEDCQKAPNPILPEGNEILWGGLGFLVLFLLLWKKGLPPIRNMMKAREEKIRGDLERAEQARLEAEQERARYEAQLAKARADSNRIVEEAREAAEQVRRELTTRAETEAAEIRARAQQDARLAAERAMRDLQQRVSEISIELAEKIVERNLDRDTQLALVESFISSVGNAQPRSN